MSVSENDHNSQADGFSRGKLPTVIALGILVPMVGTLLLGQFFNAWTGFSLPLHSTLEVAGAVLGLVLAALILFSRQSACTSRKMLVACALSSMAVLDMAHSCVPVGNAFVWLHSLAVLAGGIFFALVWLPEHDLSMKRALTTSGSILLIVILIALFSAAYPEGIPAMVAEGHFTVTANLLNFLGGGLTLLGALNFALRYARARDGEDLLFLILALFFGLPGVLFQISDIWEAGWWFWHALRLAAYGIAFWLAFLTYRKFEGRILRTQSELDTLFHASIDGKRMIDAEFNQVRANDTFARMPGVKKASGKDSKCYELFPRPICHTPKCPLTRLKSGTTNKVEQELELPVADGSKRHYIVVSVPILGGDGAFRGIVESFYDITKRKVVEKELAEHSALKTALADLANVMRGGPDPRTLCRDIISFLCPYLGAQIGLMYLAEKDGLLKPAAGYANNRREMTTTYRPGEGLVGQTALSKKEMSITKIPEDHMVMASGLGHVKPRNIHLKPVIHNGEVIAVIELGTLDIFTDSHRKFLNLANDNIAVAVDSAKSRKQLALSLEESQQLSETLQSKQVALKAANEELEQQSEELQSANEELEQQSEELRTSNEELEEKTEALEQQKKEIQQAKSRVEETARKLALAGKYKSEFLANMSHELRTPLNSLLILAKLLADNEEKNLTEEQVESARIIHGSGQDLLFLINEILDLSKVEAGMMELHPEEISLETLIDSLQQQFQGVAKEKGLAFEILKGPEVPQSIRTDRQRLEQILRNFLSNALKFTKEGTVTLEILRPDHNVMFVSGHLTYANTLGLSVRDTGSGIPDGKREAIFEAFQQVDGSVSRRYGGTGLGLSISQALAHLLKAEIQLVSQVGKGSTFTLYLPLERRGGTTAEGAHDTPSKGDVPKRRTVRPENPAQPKSAQSHFVPDDRDAIKEGDRSLLIIEDDARFVKILADHARKKDFKCLVAGDGKSGLELATAYKPSAIILDLGLPDIDGTTVLDALKYGLETRHIPVHVMSGREKTSDIMQKGAIGFLTKPIDAVDIRKTLDRIGILLESTVRRILVVEDDEMGRKAVETLVSAEGVQITGANSGEEALKAVSHQNFDCVILDLGLPDMSGFDLLRTLNEDPGLNLPPVIVYTGRDLTDMELRELSQYTTKVVVKGANSPERLLDEVSLFLHTVESTLPGEQQRILRMLHDPEKLLRGKKILLADDDLRNSFALSKVLKNAGLTVVMAENGQVALEVLEKEDVDMVLMDIMMPVMDGYDAMERIRRQPRFKDLPMVALTAKAMVEDRTKCIKAGANDYLPKPVDTAKLLSLMRVLLYP
ncbi:MAG: response regulator [Deltaproteobacteria bacterium]|nr:response regulator [Deltaproteobacteria bacterium]